MRRKHHKNEKPVSICETCLHKAICMDVCHPSHCELKQLSEADFLLFKCLYNQQFF